MQEVRGPCVFACDGRPSLLVCCSEPKEVACMGERLTCMFMFLYLRTSASLTTANAAPLPLPSAPPPLPEVEAVAGARSSSGQAMQCSTRWVRRGRRWEKPSTLTSTPVEGGWWQMRPLCRVLAQVCETCRWLPSECKQ